MNYVEKLLSFHMDDANELVKNYAVIRRDNVSHPRVLCGNVFKHDAVEALNLARHRIWVLN